MRFICSIQQHVPHIHLRSAPPKPKGYITAAARSKATSEHRPGSNPPILWHVPGNTALSVHHTSCICQQQERLCTTQALHVPARGHMFSGPLARDPTVPTAADQQLLRQRTSFLLLFTPSA
eukprot:scaffold285325_cov22-Tisochrysis_lutea.AAC.1